MSQKISYHSVFSKDMITENNGLVPIPHPHTVSKSERFNRSGEH